MSKKFLQQPRPLREHESPSLPIHVPRLITRGRHVITDGPHVITQGREPSDLESIRKLAHGRVVITDGSLLITQTAVSHLIPAAGLSAHPPADPRANSIVSGPDHLVTPGRGGRGGVSGVISCQPATGDGQRKTETKKARWHVSQRARRQNSCVRWDENGLAQANEQCPVMGTTAPRRGHCAGSARTQTPQPECRQMTLGEGARRPG